MSKKFYVELNLNKYYYNLWKKNLLKMKLNRGATIISKAILMLNRKLFSKNRIKKLFRKYSIKNLVDFFILIKTDQKKYIAIDLGCNRLEKVIKYVVFKKIKKLSYLKEKLFYLINRNKYYKFVLMKNLIRWKMINDRINFIKKVIYYII